MKTVRMTTALRDLLADWRRGGDRIALVPTMGNLHPGHISLVGGARDAADRVVVSIFVNPTQFGHGEDYDGYPRTPDHDRRRLARAGADVLFAPEATDMYPGGIDGATVVTVPRLSETLCGEHRPGHFDGVTSVVSRLFNIVQPDVAVFGQKDYQQLVILRRMAVDLHCPVQVLMAPTRRDDDGLAMSSRNQYLSPAERTIAPTLYAILRRCADAVTAGRHDFPALEEQGRKALREAGFRPDYVAVRRAVDLAVPTAADTELVIMAAARLGRTRLIDNILVEKQHP